MAVEYASDTLAELESMVARSLELWNLSASTSVRLLNVSENATFELIDASLADASLSRRLIVRVHRAGYSSAAEIGSELEWVESLRRGAVIETAAPIEGRNGRWLQTLASPRQPSRHAVAFEWLAGEQPVAGANAMPWFERLGELTARMHRHAKNWRRPAGFTRKRWDLESMVGPRAHWGPWRAAPGLNAAGIELIERSLVLLRGRLERYGIGAERFGLVHADLRLANLLVHGDHLQIIDFDDCGFGWFMYDFAAAVSFIEHDALLPALLDAWVEGYCKVCPLPAEDRAAIPVFVILRRISLTAWLASHAEVPFARETTPGYPAGTVALADEFLRGRFLS